MIIPEHPHDRAERVRALAPRRLRAGLAVLAVVYGGCILERAAAAYTTHAPAVAACLSEPVQWAER